MGLLAATFKLQGILPSDFEFELDLEHMGHQLASSLLLHHCSCILSVLGVCVCVYVCIIIRKLSIEYDNVIVHYILLYTQPK